MPAIIPGLPGGSEWIIILIIALLIFGKRLPEVMRSMGQSIRQFKKGMNEVDLGDEGEDGKKSGDNPPAEQAAEEPFDENDKSKEA